MSLRKIVVRPHRARNVFLLSVALSSALGDSQLHGQAVGHIDGRVLDLEGAPLPGATVRVAGRGVGAVTDGEGAFRVLRVEPGSHALLVERLGYATETRDVDVHADGTSITIEMTPSPLDIGGFVVTGALRERRAGEALRPATVLSGQELQQRLQATVAATLAAEPGLATTTMGPATARPVIRGMSGDRVLILEDGARVADVSNTHADHATALDPASATRIEVVRGPASLLYGSNALGGVVNVIRDEVPSSVPYRPTGSATAQTQSVNRGYGVNATMLTGINQDMPVRVEATGRTSGDLNTPAGNLLNTWADSWSAAVGTGWVADWGHVGGSIRAYRSDYGVPGGFTGGHSQGVRIEIERTASKLRTQFDNPAGPFSSLRIDGLLSDYRHVEVEAGDIVGTVFERALGSGDIVAHHDAMGPFSAGVIGGRSSWENLEYRGALSTPDSRRYTAAAFLFEEVDLGVFRIEAGLRYDWVRIDPAIDDPGTPIGHVRARTFSSWSGSLGLLHDLGAGLTVGANVAQAFRAPDVGELYSEGPHLAVYAFEVGNPELGTEVGRGLDAFMRFHSDVLQVELTGFYNDISGYIYAENTGRISRVQLPVYQFQGNDARLTGLEGALRWHFANGFELNGTGSFVRGTLSEADEPLPLIPPLQGRAAIAHDRTAWFVRAESELSAEQARTGEFEEPTAGYAVFNLASGLRLTLGGRLHVITLSVENLTNDEYRNHLSRVKEIMPEAGRGLRLTYRVVF